MFLTLLAVLMLATTMPVLVLTLISTFTTLFLFSLFIGAEFLGISFLIIYIGAIAILFIFTLMVIDSETRVKVRGLSPMKLVTIGLFAMMGYSVNSNLNYRINYEAFTSYLADQPANIVATVESVMFQSHDLMIFSILIYNNYKTMFLISGLLLVVAIIGVIAMTIPSRIPLFNPYKHN